MDRTLIKRLVREELQRRLDEAEALSPSAQAKELGLEYIGFGRYIDPKSPKPEVVAKTVGGHLTKLAVPEPIEDPELEPDAVKFADDTVNKQKSGHWQYQGNGSAGIKPGWNKGMVMSGDYEDIPFDANADKTVAALLQKVGDPKKLVNWLVKKAAEETPNGKKRMLQYLKVLKSMGVVDSDDGDTTAPTAPSEAPAPSNDISKKPLALTWK